MYQDHLLGLRDDILDIDEYEIGEAPPEEPVDVHVEPEIILAESEPAIVQVESKPAIGLVEPEPVNEPEVPAAEIVCIFIFKFSLRSEMFYYNMKYMDLSFPCKRSTYIMEVTYQKSTLFCVSN